MRRFQRPIVIAVAGLGLALGAGLGLAAPALADPGFTASVENAPLVAGATEIDFTGQIATTSAITAASINIPGDISSCSSIAAGGATWSCEFDASSPLTAGNFSAQFVETDADNTQTTQVLSFVVHGAEETPAPVATPTSPIVAYQFTPGGVTVTGNATGAGNATETQILVPGASGGAFETAVSCPNDVNSDAPLGTDPGSPVSCSDSGLTNDAPVVAATQQGTTAPPAATTVSNDGSFGVFYVPANNFSLVGAPPVAFSVDSTAHTVTVTGSLRNNSFSQGNGVVVRDTNGGILCRTTVRTGSLEDDPLDNNVDTWSCTTSALSLGTHDLTVAVEDEGQLDAEGQGIYLTSRTQGAGEPYGYYVHGALSSSTVVGTVTFSLPTVPVTPTVTTDITPTWSFSIGGDLTNVHPGDTLTISGAGLPAGTSLDTILHSVPTDLGTVVAAADGSFTQTATVPADTPLGDHTVLVTASGPGITTTTKQQAITVTAVPIPASGSSGSSGKTGVVAPKPAATHGNGGSANGSGIAPNILTRALTPLADVTVHPNKIVSAFEIGLVLLLLAVLPAHLLNATIAEQSDRFEKRFGKARMPNWLFRLGVWFRSAPVVGGIIVTLVTAILFGFADPKFGFTLASLRLILACGIALFLVGYVANALTGVIARVQWNVVAAVSTRPYGLILTVVGVLVSRFLHFSPGFLIGLILGLTIQGKSASGFAWRTIVLRSSIVLAMAIAAWIGYSTLTLGGNEGGTFWSALLVETLVAITTEGIVALLVELLPLRFLEGERVYEHSRVLWGIFYVLTLIVFVLAVVPWEGNWDALHGTVLFWIVVLAVFAAVCVGVYIFFRRFMPPLEEEDGEEKVPLGETVSRERK